MITQNKVSVFFSAEDTLKNELNQQQSYLTNKLVMYNINYCASRLDLIKFALNANFEIVNWYMDPEVMRKLRMYELSPHSRGLAVEFKVTDRISNKYAFELLKTKVLKKNSLELSVHELIYNKTRNTIYVSFKTNIELEKNKIGIMEKGVKFIWTHTERNVFELTRQFNGGNQCKQK